MDLITVIVKNLHNLGIVRGKPFKQKDSLRRKVKKLIQTYDQTSRTTYKLELRYYLGEILDEYKVRGIKSHQRVEARRIYRAFKPIGPSVLVEIPPEVTPRKIRMMSKDQFDLLVINIEVYEGINLGGGIMSEENPPSDHVTADLIGKDRLMLEDNITSVIINAQEGEDNHSQNQISLEKSDASQLLPDIPEEFQIAPEAIGDDWMQLDMTGNIQGEIEWKDFIG